MPPFRILVELRMMEVVVTTGEMHKAAVKSSSTTNQHSSLQPDALPVPATVRTLKEESVTFYRIAQLESSILVLTIKGSRLPFRGFPRLLIMVVWFDRDQPTSARQQKW